jgi:hypothetical protein
METSLSAREICTIIKASKDSGVKSIIVPGLTIEFYPHRNEASESHRNVESGIPVEIRVAEVETKIPAEWGDQAEMFDKEAISDAEESALMVDDPMAFERHIVSRDIERNRMMEHG